MTVRPGNLIVSPLSSSERPRVSADIPFDSSYVYDKNRDSPAMCLASGPLAVESLLSGKGDLFEVEWSRVRLKPNLSNCVQLGTGSGCHDF